MEKKRKSVVDDSEVDYKKVQIDKKGKRKSEEKTELPEEKKQKSADGFSFFKSNPPGEGKKEEEHSSGLPFFINPGKKEEQSSKDPSLLHVGQNKMGEGIFLKKFDFKMFRPENHGGDGLRIGVIGKSGSGKTSTITMKALPELCDMGAWRIVNPSEKTNGAYGPYCENDLIIHDDADTGTILPLLYDFRDRQMEIGNIWKIPGTKPKKYFRDPVGVLILDDANEDPKLFNDPIFGWLYQNSRNANTVFFHLVQYAKTLCPKYRQQLSYLMLWAMNSKKEIENIYKEFGGAFESFAQFEEVYRVCTANKGCMIIWQDCPTQNIEDRVFWYKNDFVAGKPFKLGAPWFRKLQRELHNPKYEATEVSRLNMTDEERAATIGKKRKGAAAAKTPAKKKDIFLVDH